MKQSVLLLPNLGAVLDDEHVLVVNAITINGTSIDLPLPIVIRKEEKLTLEFEGGALFSLETK